MAHKTSPIQVKGISPGILQPILQHRFKVVFAINETILEGLTRQLIKCNVDMLGKRLTLTFESVLCDLEFDKQLDELVRNPHSVLLQLQYTTGAGYIAKADSFDGLKVTKCDYKADYTDPDSVKYHMEMEYSNRYTDLAPSTEEEFSESLKKQVENLIFNKYMFEPNTEQTHEKLVTDVEFILRKMSASWWSVETDNTCIDTNDLRLRIDFKLDYNSQKHTTNIEVTAKAVTFDELVDNPKNND